MINNFTPLDIEKIKDKSNYLNTILLSIVTLTMAVLAVVLFVLIQKKINEQKIIVEPDSTIEFESKETPTLSPTIFERESELSTIKEASETPVLSVTPVITKSEIDY